MWLYFGRGGDTVGNPHRAQNYRFELFERAEDAVGDPRRAQIPQFEFFELKFIGSSFSSLSPY